MTTTIADAVYFPPPLASRDSLPPREFASQMRRKVLAAFSARAFEDEVLSRRLFGRVQLTLNRPEAIRHVLIDNAENYGCTVATVRLLYPIVGCGLFLAEGEDWKIQRRTVDTSTQSLSRLKNVKGGTRSLPLVCRLPTLELV
jgi:cytochrome P450